MFARQKCECKCCTTRLSLSFSPTLLRPDATRSIRAGPNRRRHSERSTLASLFRARSSPWAFPSGATPKRRRRAPKQIRQHLCAPPSAGGLQCMAAEQQPGRACLATRRFFHHDSSASLYLLLASMACASRVVVMLDAFRPSRASWKQQKGNVYHFRLRLRQNQALHKRQERRA